MKSSDSVDRVVEATFENVLLALTGKSPAEIQTQQKNSRLKRTKVKVSVSGDSYHLSVVAPIKVTEGSLRHLKTAAGLRLRQATWTQVVDVTRVAAGTYVKIRVEATGLPAGMDALKLDGMRLPQYVDKLEAKAKSMGPRTL